MQDMDCDTSTVVKETSYPTKANTEIETLYFIDSAECFLIPLNHEDAHPSKRVEQPWVRKSYSSISCFAGVMSQFLYWVFFKLTMDHG